MIPEISRLRRAIRDLHGVEGTHLRSEPVHETFQRDTVWEGVVEVLALKGHPKAGAGLRLEPRDPIKSRRDAMRPSIAAGARRSG